MIVDTSALVAIVQKETNESQLLGILLESARPRISAANLLELWMVIDGRKNPTVIALLDGVLSRITLIVTPVTEDQVIIAREAFRQFGKGSGHPARLNFGDCFAYALAKSLDEPLLFVGNDFLQTDIVQEEC